MTETQRWVNETCEQIMASGHVHLYRDLYKDLRGQLPCGVVCSLIMWGLLRTRLVYLPEGGTITMHKLGDRGRAIAALRRLTRYAARKTGRTWEETIHGL